MRSLIIRLSAGTPQGVGSARVEGEKLLKNDDKFL